MSKSKCVFVRTPPKHESGNITVAEFRTFDGKTATTVEFDQKTGATRIHPGHELPLLVGGSLDEVAVYYRGAHIPLKAVYALLDTVHRISGGDEPMVEMVAADLVRTSFAEMFSQSLEMFSPAVDEL